MVCFVGGHASAHGDAAVARRITPAGPSAVCVRGRAVRRANARWYAVAFWKQPAFRPGSDDGEQSSALAAQAASAAEQQARDDRVGPRRARPSDPRWWQEVFQNAFANASAQTFSRSTSANAQASMPFYFTPWRIDDGSSVQCNTLNDYCVLDATDTQSLAETSTRVRVLRVTPRSADGSAVEIALALDGQLEDTKDARVSRNSNLSEPELARLRALFDMHTTPGQVVVVSPLCLQRQATVGAHRGGNASYNSPVVLTLASPPGNSAKEFRVIFNSRSAGNSLGFLKRCRAGDELLVSPVMGVGLDVAWLTQKANALLLADNLQGMAAITSLLQWNTFRAAAGQGVIRSTSVRVLYEADSLMAVPYAGLFRELMIYGVRFDALVRPRHRGGEQLHPHQPGSSAMSRFLRNADSSKRSAAELAQQLIGQQGIEALANATRAVSFAVRDAVAREWHEALMMLALSGSESRTVSQERVAADCSDELFELSDMWDNASGTVGATSGPEDDFVFERRVWQAWCDIREEMRVEFEKKWAAGARKDWRTSYSEHMKNQAWASWFASNSDRWTDFRWDDSAWKTYWSAWSSESRRESSNPGGRHAYASQDSAYGAREWWRSNTWGQNPNSDWSNHTHTNSGRSSYHDTYSSGGGSWGAGSASDYQAGGYRYDWDPYASRAYEGRAGYGQKGGSSAGGGGSRQSQSNNYNRQSYAGRGSSASGAGGSFDFYGVLGLQNGASAKEIKSAYRQMAMKYHPDRNMGNKAAEETMKKITLAYTVLKKSSTRSRYDSYGAAGI
ncbi:Chaperone protein DnaJ [Porphyridium purpureum]|uniref:Chaperone protein DnaJ n=1 Tax=Porphyridium purpureum TaxID=35688 RepID=A0A5J4YJ95_PORPP|nr:Chaperone protein DnaJ [Porphyridium purpureum]|eukprot:POR1229..scf251_18